MSEDSAVEQTSPIIQDIEFDDLNKGLVDGTLKLVDVRDTHELETQGKIPKSINIPLPEIPDAFRNLSDEEFKKKYGFSKNDENLVFSCKSGRRAEAAINHVYGGDPSIVNFRLYRGSFLDWEAKGGPIEK